MPMPISETPMIAQLLPAAVSSVSLASDEPHGELLPEEAAQFGWAVASRRHEFVAGRYCAHQALERLGLPASPILRGPRREPLWPSGVVGSITHCLGFQAAAVALARDVIALGIDAEPHDRLPANVLQSVSVPEERSWLARAPSGLHWDRLLFSAKESVYKAWYPLTGRSLEFEQVNVRFEPVDGTFYARLLMLPPLRPAAIDGFAGRFLVKNGLILTAITVLQSVAKD